MITILAVFSLITVLGVHTVELKEHFGDPLPVSVTLSEPGVVKVRENVLIELSVKNIGDHPLRIPVELFCGAGYLSCEFDPWVDEDGNRRGGRGGIETDRFSRSIDKTVLLDPGAFYGRTMRFPTSKPTEYRFRVYLWIAESDLPEMKKGWAESNWVSIRVE